MKTSPAPWLIIKVHVSIPLPPWDVSYEETNQLNYIYLTLIIGTFIGGECFKCEKIMTTSKGRINLRFIKIYYLDFIISY